MSKHYTSQDILEMSARLQEPDLAADLDGDGEVTHIDARLARNGVDVPDPSTAMSQAALDRLMTAQPFQYDGANDPALQRYREMYEAAGAKAAENAFGLASAHTGGYGSSYAAAVASDAYALYMDKLAAKGAELEQQAYDRYRDDRADQFRLLDAAQEQEDRVYSRETDAEERQRELAKDAADRQYRRERDEKEDEFRERELENKDRDYERSARNDWIGFAFDAAEAGDYSYLAALGVDTSALTRKDVTEAAELYAKYGDYSGLEKLGVDVSSLKRKDAMDQAAFYAKFGDLSGLAAMGVDVSRMSKDQLYEVAALFAKYGDYSLLNLLV